MGNSTSANAPVKTPNYLIDLIDYLKKLKAFNRMVKVKRLFNEKGQQGIVYFDSYGKV